MTSIANGQLSRKEKRHFVISLIKSQVQEKIQYFKYFTGITDRKNFSLDDVQMPNSKLVYRAIEEAEENYSSVLLQHCYRTFYWSGGFGKTKGLKYDPELLFVASILHDIALADKHNHICGAKCFAVHGGEFSKSFALQHGTSKSMAAKLEEAIRLHLNPEVDRKKYGNEAYLLSRGAAMDVIGSYTFQIPEKYIGEVHTRYSREGFKDEIIGTMENFDHLRDTRANLLFRLGFARQARKNKLDKENKK